MQNNEKCLDTVRASRLFKDMPEEFVLHAVGRMRLMQFQVGETILCEKQDVHTLGILACGEAAVYKTAGGGKLLISVLPEGSLIGAATLFLNNGGAATEIRAKRACRIACFDEELVKELMRSSFEFTLRYATYLTERIHFLTQRIESIGCTTAGDKLYSYLLQCSEDGRVVLPMGMGELAEALNMSRASLYRVMDALEDTERIRRDGKTIYIL